MDPTKRWTWAALALCVGLTLLVGAPLLAGRTFAPTDLLSSRPPWGSAHGTDAYVQNRLHQDILEFNTMHGIAADEALKDGRLLLWNPALFCGVPSAGDPQLGTFYPLRPATFALFPPLQALDVFILVHFLAAGLAMFAAAREWGAGGPGALVASATWMLCGQQMVWFKYGSGLVAAASLPLMTIALRRAVDRPGAAGAAGAGALWALGFTGSHPQLSFLALVWAGAFLAARIPAAGWRRIGLLAVSFAAAGAGLAAVQLLPFLDALIGSHKAGTTDSLTYARPWRVPLLLATLFWQRAFGSPLDRVDMVPSWTGSNFFEFQGYVGLLPLALAAAAWGRSRLLAGTALATLVLAVFYPAWWIVKTVLPFVSVLVPHRLFLFSFAMALLAGLGFERLLRQPPGRRWVLAAGLGAAGVIGAGAVGALRSSTWISLGNPAYFSLALAAALAALAWRGLASGLAAPAKAALATAAVLGDLLPGFLAYNAAHGPPPPEPPALARLPREERVVVQLESPYYRFAFRNYLLMYGRSTPGGYASLFPRRYAELAEALGGTVGDRSVEFDAGDERAFRLLNVGAVLTREGERRVEPLPRAWLVGRAEVVTDPAERRRRLADPSFDPASTALLEEAVPDLPGHAAGRVERRGEGVYHVASEAPALLLVSESYDGGWRCDVDGRPARILRANHALRAVALAPGTHTVRFEYRPGTVRLGAWVSGLTLAALCAGLGLRLRALRRNP